MNRLRLQMLDHRVAIEAFEPTLLDELAQLLTPFPSLPDGVSFDFVYRLEGERTGYRVLRNGILLQEGIGREDCFATIQEDLAFFLVQHRTFGLLHAAALLKGEKVVLLPGPSGSGKTTLAALLLKHGYLYLSDEFAPVSFDLTVMPYPVPLKLRASTLRLLPPLAPEVTLWPNPFWARGEQVFYGLPTQRLLLTGEWPVGLIVFPQPDELRKTEVHRLQPGTAALWLLAMLLNWDLLGEAGFSAVAELVTRIPCYTLTSGKPGEAVQAIEDLGRGHDG